MGDPLLVIVGPTAAGKSALAIELAARLGGECISADSMQVYRGMDIGTAKPTPRQRAAVPHHGLDLVDPREDGFSVDAWLTLARRVAGEIRLRRRRPIVVGGTNLYVQALLEGLFEGPAPDAAVRARLDACAPHELRRRLAECDPAAAERIHANDRKRTIRALEVYELTGRPISELQSQWFTGAPRRDVRLVGLSYSTPVINGRINARVRAMIDAGLVEEVRGLLAAGGLGRQAAEAVGYREVIDHLHGRLTLAEAVERIKIRTRRLARQQRTWLRRFRAHPDAVWIEADELSPQALVEKTFAAVCPEAGPSGPRAPDSRAPGGVSERLS